MSCTAAKMFMAYMESKDMKCRVMEDDDNILKVGWNLDNCEMTVYFSFDENDKYVQLHGCDFIQIPENKMDAMLDVVNECNHEYRWVKFVLDKKNREIITKCDCVIDLETAAEETFELMIRTIQIVDEAYPIFMKSLWA